MCGIAELITKMRGVRQAVNRLTNMVISRYGNDGEAIMENHVGPTLIFEFNVQFPHTTHGAPHLEAV